MLFKGIFDFLTHLISFLSDSPQQSAPLNPCLNTSNDHCLSCGRAALPVDNLNTVTTPPTFPSETEELRLLKDQVQDVSRVCYAIARGDLTQRITVPVQGIIAVQLKDIVNTMVEKLGEFAKEITCMSHEVGTEG
jgi:hypothetical protein